MMGERELFFWRFLITIGSIGTQSVQKWALRPTYMDRSTLMLSFDVEDWSHHAARYLGLPDVHRKGGCV